MLDTNKNTAKRLTAYCVAVTKEQEQKGREIKKSSIVKVKEEEGEAIVTAVCPSGVAYIMWKDGSCGDYDLSDLEDTGKIAVGLEVLLQQISA